MCMRRAIFERVGGFYGTLGRGASARFVSGDETELCIRARKAFPGQRFVFEPAISARHKVSAERITWRYFRRRCYAEGISKAVIVNTAGAETGLALERGYTFKTLPRGVARGLVDTLARADLSGLLRSAAIVFGFSCTLIGYGYGTIQCRFGGINKTATIVKA